MSETTSTKIYDNYTPGFDVEGDPEDPWSGGHIAGYGKFVSAIEGELADRVRARMGVTTGDVTIIEDHWDIGYCVTCSDEQIDFEVQLDGEKVFRTQYYSGGSQELGALEISGYAQFNDWLNGGESEA